MSKKIIRCIIGCILGGGVTALGIPLARWFAKEGSAMGWAAAAGVMLTAFAGGLMVFLYIFAEKAQN